MEFGAVSAGDKHDGTEARTEEADGQEAPAGQHAAQARQERAARHSRHRSRLAQEAQGDRRQKGRRRQGEADPHPQPGK